MSTSERDARFARSAEIAREREAEKIARGETIYRNGIDVTSPDAIREIAYRIPYFLGERSSIAKYLRGKGRALSLEDSIRLFDLLVKAEVALSSVSNLLDPKTYY